MKKTIFTLMLLGAAAFMFAANFELQTGLRAAWESNVYNLSDPDLTAFEDGDQEFDFVETSDDFIFTPFMRLKYNLKLAGVTLTPAASVYYHGYASNTDKNRSSGYAGLSADFGRVSVSAGYGYYPDYYTRQYEDNDGTLDWQKYTYDRNLYKLSGNWEFVRHTWLIAGYSRWEYFYNKYFTEYDGARNDINVALKHAFSAFYLRLGYTFSDFVLSDDVPSLSQAQLLSHVRDGSYQADTWEAEVRSKKIKLNKKQWWRPFAGFTWEKRYWTTDYPRSIDPVHSDREDNTYNVNVGLELGLIKDVDVSLNYTHSERKSEAAWDGLSDIKDYSDNQVEMEIIYNLSF